MKKYNITCECGYDADFRNLTDARREAKKHISHNPDKQVYICQIETDPLPGENYLTGREWIIK